MLVPEQEFALETVLQPSRIYSLLAEEMNAIMVSFPKLVREHNHLIGDQQNAGDQEPACCQGGDDWTDLFDSCVFYLVGFPDRMLQQMQVVIRRGLGTIFYDFALFQVTHVVVSPSLQDVATLTALEKRVLAADADSSLSFVSPMWLVDSLKTHRLEPEELYPVEIDENHYHPDIVDSTNATALETSTEEVAKGDVPLVDEPEATVQVEPNTDVTHVANEMAEHEPKGKVFEGCAFLLLCVNPDDRHLAKLIQNLTERGGAEAIALDYRDFGNLEPREFGFVTHVVLCSGVSIDEGVASTVLSKFELHHREAEKQHATDEKRSRKRKRHHGRVFTFVSDLWVNCSLTAQVQLSHHSHELFTATVHQPRSMFPVPLPLKCFRAVRASTSVYMDVDQVVVAELLRLAGAKVTSKMNKLNTHLICQKPFGMKFEKAKEWGIKVVTARWVIESMMRGKLLDVSRPEFQVTDDGVAAAAGSDPHHQRHSKMLPAQSQE